MSKYKDEEYDDNINYENQYFIHANVISDSESDDPEIEPDILHFFDEEEIIEPPELSNLPTVLSVYKNIYTECNNFKNKNLLQKWDPESFANFIYSYNFLQAPPEWAITTDYCNYAKFTVP
jgi:hypothetical protein